jgi:hypothetical protein
MGLMPWPWVHAADTLHVAQPGKPVGTNKQHRDCQLYWQPQQLRADSQC